MRHGWLLCLTGLGLLSGCAKEKKTTEDGWAAFPVAIYADPAIVSTPAGEEDFQAALTFWENSAGQKLFDYKGEWTGQAKPFSGNPELPSSIEANTVFFQSPWPFGPNVGGQTTVIKSQRGILGAVVMINPSLLVCHGDCDGDTLKISQRKLLAHELGHFIGLSHNQDVSSIMYPSLSPGGSLAKVTVDTSALQQLTR